MSRPREVDDIGYDPATGTYRAEFSDDHADSVSLSIVRTVGVATGEDPEQLSPLYSVVDPDALQELLSSSPDAGVEVSFVYEGHLVTLDAAGSLSVEPAD